MSVHPSYEKQQQQKKKSALYLNQISNTDSNVTFQLCKWHLYKNVKFLDDFASWF